MPQHSHSKHPRTAPSEAGKLEGSTVTTETKFTSGPWVARPDENSSCEWEVVKTDPLNTSISQDPWFICACMDDADGASAEDNARLIAAAPELYEVARMVVEASEVAGFSGPLGDAARAALSKARGEA